jgi:glycosyltransferase involved in cell wall biosynthesis
LKVAVVSSGNIPSQYANSINTVRHADGFLKNGHDVKIFTVVRQREKKYLKGLNINSHYNIKNIPIEFINDYSLYYFNKFNFLRRIISNLGNLPFFNRFINKSAAEKKISHKILSEKYDLSYCRSYYTTLYNIDLGVNTIMETHAANPEKIPQIVAISKKSHSKFFKGIVTIHNKIKDRLMRMGFPENKIIVLEDAVQHYFIEQKLPNIEQLKISLNLPPNKKIITYVGSLKKGKGIVKIIKLSRALLYRDDIIFHLVGGSQKEIGVIKKKHNPSSNVFFSGFINGSEIPKYLACSDLLLLLYDINEKNPVMDLETTSPIKLFEYMSSGKPILATRLPTIEKIVDFKEDILIYEDLDLTNQIKKIIDNLEYYKKRSPKIRKMSKSFTYEKRVNKIISTLFIK